MKTIIKANLSEEEAALDYLMSLKFKDGKTLISYYQGDPKNEAKVSLKTIANLAAQYHRDNSPIVQERTGRKFKEG